MRVVGALEMIGSWLAAMSMMGPAPHRKGVGSVGFRRWKSVSRDVTYSLLISWRVDSSNLRNDFTRSTIHAWDFVRRIDGGWMDGWMVTYERDVGS